MDILFFTLLFVLLYVYFLYPLVLSLKKGSTDISGFLPELAPPFISVIIAAYNEERQIVAKMRDALSQDYPEDRFEIIVTSDGSTDQTVPIARSIGDKRVRVIENLERRGKNGAINRALPETRGEIIVFTDTNTFFMADVLKKLTRPFQDPAVGVVCGHLKYVKAGGSHVGKGEGLYFRYESWIKRLESRWGTVSVVTGAIYAIRKELASPLEPDVANDFAHPVQAGAKGYKVVFEPEAIAFERTTESISEEFRRRARIVTRGFTAFGKYWKAYGLLRGMRGFCFVSHKLLRWFAPFFLLALFVSNLFLEGAFFTFALYGQIAFYAAAFCGIFIRKRLGRILAVPFYFCMINLAALVGFIRYLRGKRQSFWEVAPTTR